MRLNLVGYRFMQMDGYGRFAGGLIRALVRAGIEVHPIMCHMVEDMPEDLLRLTGFDPGARSLYLMPPVAIQSVPPPHSIIYTMHEDSRLPEGWARTINQFERCIVPCEHNAEVFRDSGVTIPLHVVYGGTEPAELLPEPPARPYTFLCLGDRGMRKGYDVVWEAFYRAFNAIDDVRLIVKVRPAMKPPWLDNTTFTDPRVRWWVEEVSDMRPVFAAADCVVYPSRGEGWGMWNREAVSMGLPAIVTRHSGNAVGIDHWAIPLEKFGFMESQLNTGGMWVMPDPDEVAEKMLWAYRHQDAAWEIGRKGAAWLREHQSWDCTVKRLLELLEQYP